MYSYPSMPTGSNMMFPIYFFLHTPSFVPDAEETDCLDVPKAEFKDVSLGFLNIHSRFI